MSLKPIDYQALLPKAAEVARVNSAEHHKQNAVFEHVVKAAVSRTESERKQVHQREKAQEAAVKGYKDQNNRNDNSGKKKKQDRLPLKKQNMQQEELYNSGRNKQGSKGYVAEKDKNNMSTIDIKV